LRAAEHIPSELIARWDQTQTSLRGLARLLTRRHLESCIECRQDLEVLGFAPVLRVVPELEPPPEILASLTPAVAAGPAPTEPAHPVRIRMVSPRRTGWLVGWAAASTIAATALFLARGTAPPPAPAPEPRPTANPSSAMTIRLDVLSEAVTLHAPTRGATEAAPIVSIPRGTHSVALRFDPLDLPDETIVHVAVLNERGQVLSAADYPQRDLYPHKTLMLASTDTLAAGRYVLRVAGGGTASPPQEVAFPFTIVVR
jgi:hypothetical protein